MEALHRYTGAGAVVTGAGSGIGQGTAERLAREGASVAIVDVDTGAAEQVAAGIRDSGGTARAYTFDVADRNEYERTFKRMETELGPITLLVNNAAVGGSGTLQTWDDATLSRVVDVNIRGVLNGLSVVGTAMALGQGGAVVNLASMAGIRGIPGMIPYTVSKGAVVAITRAAAMELAPAVRVNAIAPGKIVTPFREKMFGVALTDDELAEIGASLPLQRVGQPADIAGVVAFLGSNDAAFMTGITLPVDGGRTSGFLAG